MFFGGKHRKKKRRSTFHQDHFLSDNLLEWNLWCPWVTLGWEKYHTDCSLFGGQTKSIGLLSLLNCLYAKRLSVASGDNGPSRVVFASSIFLVTQNPRSRAQQLFLPDTTTPPPPLRCLKSAKSSFLFHCATLSSACRLWTEARLLRNLEWMREGRK